nr:GATA zinc finger domain-containing protein 10 [Ipomoea batatas]GMD69609.1 GATA zinc finger domain-containing protein 10 [Ipomoea batatas]
MRRGGGHYGGAGDSTANNAYSQIQHHPQHGRSEEQQHQQQQQQWRWERESPKLPTNAMSPHMFSEGQGAEASRSYYQGQRTDPRMPLENQGGKDLRSQPIEEDMDIGYEDNPMPQSLEGLEQKFLDDIMKLSKEQNDAEDAENARHRERINAINTQYQEQLVALRARHASRREDVLRRESHARRQQYQQVALDNHPNTNAGGPIDPRGYAAPPPLPGERQRAAYNANNYDSYRDRNRFVGSGRDQGYEPRAQYPGGRGYDPGSRYY